MNLKGNLNLRSPLSPSSSSYPGDPNNGRSGQHLHHMLNHAKHVIGLERKHAVVVVLRDKVDFAVVS